MKTIAVSRFDYSKVRNLTLSALVIAMYLVVMYLTQGFAFGQYQVRIATALYALSALFPFLIVPLGLANLLSNVLMGGLGPLDMLGGAFAGLVTSGLVYRIHARRLNDWLLAVPILLCPGLLVPIWLSQLIGVPYSVLAVSITAGQVIPAIVGVLIVKQLRHKIGGRV